MWASKFEWKTADIRRFPGRDNSAQQESRSAWRPRMGHLGRGIGTTQHSVHFTFIPAYSALNAALVQVLSGSRAELGLAEPSPSQFRAVDSVGIFLLFPNWECRRGWTRHPMSVYALGAGPTSPSKLTPASGVPMRCAAPKPRTPGEQ